jgi:hypothetical protein
MARIIVTTDPTEDPHVPVLLEERVYPVHLDDGHAAARLIERLAWAVTDAENAQHAASARRAPRRAATRHRQAQRRA